MDITAEQAQKMVSDVQVAHRLVVGFYERLLPSLDRIAEELDCQFWYWRPMHTLRPGQSSTRPTKGWLWDMVPMFAAEHVYRKVVGARAQPGDMALAFSVYVDDSFKPEQRKILDVRGKPDPLKLEIGKAVIDIRICRVINPCDESFDDVWKVVTSQLLGLPAWRAVDKNVQYSAFQVVLSEFISDSEATQNVLKNLIAEPIPVPIAEPAP